MYIVTLYVVVIKFTYKNMNLRGRVQFPTGGEDTYVYRSPRLPAFRLGLTWWNSKADGIVRMREGKRTAVKKSFLTGLFDDAPA